MENIERKKINSPKGNSGLLFFTVIGFVLVLLVGIGAALTKFGIIPNYFNIEILCPGEPIDPCADSESPFCEQNNSYDCRVDGICAEKPIIYLYPTKKSNIQVQLDFNGKIVADYPDYNYETKGWSVTADPDGTIINHEDGLKYSYLFWEGIHINPIDRDLSKGFVVKGQDTKEFLQQTLSKIGLTPKEYNEFIVYWYPLMQNNPYNLIHFADKQYTDTAPLTITPTPDSILRVFMVFKSLDEKIEIQEQEITTFVRNGFSVVEWGGAKVK